IIIDIHHHHRHHYTTTIIIIINLELQAQKHFKPGNAYLDMPASDKRQARLLFRMASCSDASADQLDSGLQLVIRLLEVLQILVQAHARLDASNQQAEEESTTLVSDIGLCLVAADRAAARTPDADGRVSGLADLIPLQAVLSCAPAVSDRSCQYAAVGLLCRLCRLAPASAAACCRGLVDFLVGGGFFGRADRHSEELWRGLVGSVLPAYARCNPSSVPLLAQLLSAYEDMSPSRRPEVFAQLVESFEPPTRRRRLSTSVSISEDPPAAAAQQQQPQQFDSLGSSVAGRVPHHRRRSALPFLELDKAADEFGGDEYFGFDELDEELESALLPATAAAAELPAQLESRSTFRRDLLAGMAEAENSAAAMTQLFEALVNALLWATGPQQQQQGRHLASLCVRTIEAGRAGGAGCSIPAVVCGLLARPEPAVRRKALDLMLSKLTGLDRAGAVPLLRQSLLDCLAGVALICGRELVRLLGASEPKLVLNFCLGIAASSSCLPPPLLPTSTADSNSGSSSSSSSWESFGCALLVFAESVKQLGIEALPLVARLVPKLLPRLRPTVADQRPPGVVLLASFAFLQQCTVTMVDLMVPYLAQLLPVTVELMLSADSQLRPKLRSVLSSVARGVHPAQLLPALQDCLKPHQQQQPWLRAEHWARLLRLNLEMTVASEAANRLEEDDSDSADAAGSLADFEAELSDLFSSLLGNVFGSGEEDADGDSGTDDDGSESSGTESEEEGRAAAEDQAKGRLVAQLAACLAPRCHLPPGPCCCRDWAAGSASREAAFHRLMAVALASQSGRVSGLAGLLCELDAPQHAARLLELPGADSQQPRPSRQLSRWLLACLAALFKAAGGSSGLGLDLLDSIGSLLVDRLAAAADPAERLLLDCLAAYAQGSSEDEALLKPLRLLDCLGDVFIDSLAADCVPALAELAEDDSEEVEAGPAAAGRHRAAGRRAARAVQQHPCSRCSSSKCTSLAPAQVAPGGAAVERKRKFNGQHSSGQQNPPSCVVFVGEIPGNTCELEIRRIFQDFGKVQLIFPMPAKHQALVEYLRLADAERLIAYHHSGPGVNIKGSNVIISFSNRSRIDLSQEPYLSIGPQNCLLLTIYNMKMEFNCTDVRQICSPYAIIERCVIIKQ
uniref:HEAT repeat-containing protein 1 n=1 Tax=Macrostomum lignano TaxID=282301 RepID=A0A1I8F1S6_9PLAT